MPSEKRANLPVGGASGSQPYRVCNRGPSRRVRFENAIGAVAYVTGWHSTGPSATLDGAYMRCLHTVAGGASVIFSHSAEHGPRKPLSRGSVRDLSNVKREHLPARGLYSFDDLGLDLEGTNETVEVGDYEDFCFAGLDGLDCGFEALGAAFKGRSAGDV